MKLFSTEYFLSLAAVAITTAAVVVAARRFPGRWTLVFARVLAVVLVLNQIMYFVVDRNSLSVQSSLPIWICEIGTFIAGGALWWRTPLLVEIIYFWGLGGTLQALVTPELPASQLFPTYDYFQFYLNHGGIVLAAIFLVAGLHQMPRRGALVRVVAITLPYLAMVAGVDRLTGGNYLFLRQPPYSASLIGLLGPWPWYVLGMIATGSLIMVVLNSPFWMLRRGDQRDRAGDPQMARIA